ncbi:MAG: hypothetical protein ACD_17C00429G0002 [uncultured bacterium]|nr:MAG: hypothetical protein ACD_17C00429G0002 [uncultured bacterium]OGN56400.1 MAG: hypothetical protein A2796_03165 [Chlamydiae bacterium RIFCSPHIGHO2_01_FULL_44_39]OGN57659.1 MAG: hypothetical protein A3C42_06565 [Chlamydiae bacterium RIFCSPHIGHO2_02_FULL_45_9]OGN60207.1 MAG: hypothetical protein A3D96_05170 [Chlamydiae bacterium RIFCSPHIGHO2_12_FULL_44_59]OGN67139.1 MAG: hypothetical protein A2978_00870 [Chlamydiae bacterium RIFCSPLOWO2_01_FULL_44_52]OGN67729.1 MAG: hypothetical protein A3
MRTLLLQLLTSHWPRKVLSLALAMIIWMLVNHSMTVTKVVPNVPIRVSNLPAGKTIEGMQIDGTLNKRVSLTLIGHRAALENIQAKDLEILIDAENTSHEWIASIDKKHLVSLNPGLDIVKQISRVQPIDMIFRQSQLTSERIPITITQPIGEVPRGYQLLDIYPYQLSVTITGPEEAVKRLKNRGLKLTFNLNDINQEELDALYSLKGDNADEISYFVPDSWKRISLPLLSDQPIAIDDPRASFLRIDFSRQDLLPITFPIPITIFFPSQHSATINPETYALATSDFITKKNGIKLFNAPLYAQGVSRLFLETVKDRLQVVIIAAPKSEREALLWNLQFMYPHELEDRYVSKVISESNDLMFDVQPTYLEDYLRSRFRSYMNRFRLYTPNHSKLNLNIELKANAISVTPQNYP